MGRHKVDSKGNPLKRQQHIGSNGTAQPEVTTGYPAPATLEYAYDTLNELAKQDEGYWRIMPHPLDNKLYVKWKWDRGQFKNHYVFVSGSCHDILRLLNTLLMRIQLVQEGQFKPTLDKWYTDSNA